ncbi:MAG TPA: TonB-dependent receptor plug domain-containing protein [Chitinophagaceae bacterium]|nr:TonB-dependent receptor plug domain-containing protein [Chitinophagaceae bacterium]
MSYRIFFALTALLFTNIQLNSQQILDQLAGKLIQEYRNNAKELIVLQTDKTIYQAGTDIWFRAFSVSSNGFPFVNKDKVIYVELANQNDSVVDRVLLNKEALQFNGSVSIPNTLKPGFYQIRAYTKNIFQEHPADIFISSVYITNTADKRQLPKPQISTELIYKFYPEGYNLINGVNCAIVFTAADKYGIPLQVSGYVKDNFGNEMVKFTGNGIGKFVFEPHSKDRRYTVHVKTGNSTEQVFSLPEIKVGAFQLSLQKQTAEELVFRIALGDSLYNKKASSYLLGVAEGKICFASEGKGMYMVNIPVNTLPHGLIDFYLYDVNNEVKSRRTVFNENYNSVINIIADKQEYASRQKAKLNINITDKEGKPVKAVFSVSITDKKLNGDGSSMHASDIYVLSRGSSGFWINDFIHNSEMRDMVAVTLSAKEPMLKNIPEVKTDNAVYWDGLEIKGRVTGKQNEPLSGQLVILVPEEEGTALNDSTDNKGVFSFKDIIFYGKKRFHVMIPSVYDKQQKYAISEEVISFPVVRTGSAYNTSNQSLMGLSSFRQIHADSSISGNTKIYLQQLVLKEEGGNRKSNIPKKGLSPHRITAEQLDKLGFSNTADAVKMLPGIVMMGGRLTIRGGIQNLSGDLSDVEPLLIVNGVNTNAGAVIDYLNSIPPINIEYIEVLTGPEAALYGTRGGNGAIVVQTTNELRETKVDRESQTIIASGFYKEQSFYQPPYDSYAVREAAFADNRATIYWDGQIITDDAGKATFSFYTADLKNDYTVTVQGITGTGELIFKTYTIKRK